MKKRKLRVIFDTNIWISFLIGKRLSELKNYIVKGHIVIITTHQLLSEIQIVTGREKLKKYFPKEAISDLLIFLEVVGEKIDISPKNFVCRDAKDNFLLDLIEFSNADYLVTGDKDLLVLNPYKTAKIINPAEFEKQMRLFEI